MNKIELILNITKKCNYNCSYCWVVKNNSTLWKEEDIKEILDFIENNYELIDSFKFFWWEPLIERKRIIKIINETKYLLLNKYDIVTNWFFLDDEIWEYFRNYFREIFISIDIENNIDLEKTIQFIKKYDLEKKVIFNIIINPWEEKLIYAKFLELYSKWFKNFNLLPIYFTKIWKKGDLLNLSLILKNIIDKSFNDEKLYFYWFQKNNWYNFNLTYHSLFIETDLNIYYSDFVWNKFWEKYKENFYLWSIKDFKIKKYFDEISVKKEILKNVEVEEARNISWQKELHKIMDYFSNYLNIKNGI